MAAYTDAEVKSGIFITLSLVLLAGLIVIIGRLMAGDTHDYSVRFGYVNGLEMNAPVFYAGHEVGKVTSISVLENEDRPIQVQVSVARNVKLRDDSRAYIDTLGMMGEKFVELTPGSTASPERDSKNEIEGTDPIPMHRLVSKMDLLADRMDELTTSLNPMMTRLDELLAESKDDITGLIENLNGVSGNVQELTGSNELAETLENLNETSANLRDMTAELKAKPWKLLKSGE